jgi:hypothetical protein
MERTKQNAEHTPVLIVTLQQSWVPAVHTKLNTKTRQNINELIESRAAQPKSDPNPSWAEPSGRNRRIEAHVSNQGQQWLEKSLEDEFWPAAKLDQLHKQDKSGGKNKDRPVEDLLRE